jgi:hypothetical protein
MPPMPSSCASARCHSQISGKKELRQPGSRARPDQLHTLQISNKTITSQGGATLEGKRRTAWLTAVNGGEALQD